MASELRQRHASQARHARDDAPLRHRRPRRRSHARHAGSGSALDGAGQGRPALEFGVVADYFFDSQAKRSTPPMRPSGTTRRWPRTTPRFRPRPPARSAFRSGMMNCISNIHRGVFTTQANHKWNMRDGEEWLLNAEKYSSLAWLGGGNYPDAKLNGCVEACNCSTVPRSGRRLGHRRHLSRRAEGVQRGSLDGERGHAAMLFRYRQPHRYQRATPAFR